MGAFWQQVLPSGLRRGVESCLTDTRISQREIDYRWEQAQDMRQQPKPRSGLSKHVHIVAQGVKKDLGGMKDDAKGAVGRVQKKPIVKVVKRFVRGSTTHAQNPRRSNNVGSWNPILLGGFDTPIAPRKKHKSSSWEDVLLG